VGAPLKRKHIEEFQGRAIFGKPTQLDSIGGYRVGILFILGPLSYHGLV